VPVARLGKEAIIDNSTPRPVSPYYSDMSLKLAEQFNAALKDEVSPEQAVKTLQSEQQQIVEEGQAAGKLRRFPERMEITVRSGLGHRASYGAGS